MHCCVDKLLGKQIEEFGLGRKFSKSKLRCTDYSYNRVVVFRRLAMCVKNISLRESPVGASHVLVVLDKSLWEPVTCLCGIQEIALG